MTDKKYITLAYDLFTETEDGAPELVESATISQPFQFISDMGLTLETFESKVKDLDTDDKFDFTLDVEDAYGEYFDDRVVELDKAMFSVGGHFDKENIYPGNIIPLMNEDGNRFQGLILEVKEDKVVVDLNHPLSGKTLHFKGQIVESRPASEAEVDGIINRLSGGGCDCGSCGDGGCGSHDDASQGGCSGCHHGA